MERKYSSSMPLVKLLACISVLIAKESLAGLIAKTSKVDESLIDASINILESCYADRFSTVGLAGPSIGSIMTKISSKDTAISVTLIDDTLRVENHDPVDRKSRYKLQVFMITANDPKILAKTLAQVKRSKWWNHMASFLLIGSPIIENGCLKAFQTLGIAWKMNLLNSKFVCFHRIKGLLIYTFNPYTSKAPGPWKKDAILKWKNNHPWTLFVRKYREDEFHCDELDFDKTTDLGGYEVRASVRGMEDWWFPGTNIRPLLINRVQNVTAQILMNSLNATWKLLAEPFGTGPIINYHRNKTYGVAAKVTSGISDLCLNFVPQHAPESFETTYPVITDDVAILTQYPRHKSQLEKIISVLDISSRFGVLLVLLITLLFFKFWLGRPVTLAIMDLVLIVCNAALHRIPRQLAPRIYLCTLFIFVVTIQGIYQGQFASLLTKDVRLPTIDTIEDLARSDHEIYGPEAHRYLFNQAAFEKRYVANSGFHCVNNVWHDSKAACVDTVITLTDFAAILELHLSRETIGHSNGVYLIRSDWPLEERVNMIFGRAAAGGIVTTVYGGHRDSLMNDINSYEKKEQDPNPKVLTLKQLKFAFVILGIGLGWATITFIIEVAIYGKAIAKLRSCIRRYI